MLSKKNIIPLVLLAFHTIGIIGLAVPELRSEFLDLTPMNLLLTAVLLTWGLGVYNLRLLLAIGLAFTFGYLIEVAGVASGILFGEYQYGKPLGWKLFDVPVIIGVNWFILSFSSLGLIGRFISNSFIKNIVASLLMVMLDVLIEPVAIQLDFWNWKEIDVPLQNYIMWFFSAFIINGMVSILLKEIDFKTSAFVFGAQVYFFTILNLIL